VNSPMSSARNLFIPRIYCRVSRNTTNYCIGKLRNLPTREPQVFEIYLNAWFENRPKLGIQEILSSLLAVAAALWVIVRQNHITIISYTLASQKNTKKFFEWTRV
jgi:hypothetical protein